MKLVRGTHFIPLVATIAMAATIASTGQSIAQDQEQKVLVSLRANGKIEKKSDSNKTDSGKTVTKTESENQTYKLNMTVSNLGEQPVDCTLDWYFIAAGVSDGGKGKPAICEKGNATLNIAAHGKADQNATSSPMSLKTVKNETVSSGKSGKGNDSSQPKKTVSGGVFEGYIAVLRCNGTIVSKQASDRKFLTQEWLDKLEGPVTRSFGSSSGGGKSGKKSGGGKSGKKSGGKGKK